MSVSGISLVVITKDAPQATAAAVETFLLGAGDDPDVLVINNNCCEGHHAELRQLLDGAQPKGAVRYLDVTPAHGLAFCWNLGVQEARYLWVVLANDDVRFDKGWLEKFCDAQRRYPKALHISMAYPSNRYSCFALHKELARMMGPFDENFTGIFYEDEDWHLRLSEYSGLDVARGVTAGRTDLILGHVDAALHNHDFCKADRERYGAPHDLSREANEKAFKAKWRPAKDGEVGWWSKGMVDGKYRRMVRVSTNKKVLVTGGAGFIGSHLVAALLGAGRAVTVLDNLTGGYRENVPQGANLVVGSVVDESLVESLFAAEGFAHVYHLAAYAAEGLSHFIRSFNYTENLLGSVNLINASVRHSVERFVFTSSMAVYGSAPVPFTEDQTPRPEDPYGVAKYAVEMDLATAHALFKLDYTIFRPHNVYGPKQNLADPYRNVVAIFMRQCLAGQPMTIFGDGTQTRAFSHITEIIPPLVACTSMPETVGEAYNIGGRQPVTIEQLALAIAAAVGVEPRIEHLPARFEVQHAWCDHAKADALFGLPASPALDEGLRRMATWARPVFNKHAPRAFYAIEIEKGIPQKWQRGGGFIVPVLEPRIAIDAS